MLNPSGSNDSGLETGRCDSQARTAESVVDESLRAGAKLAQARQILGLTLDEIADRTKVRRDYLEAIEAMNVKFLTGRAYTVPYVKSYAQLVASIRKL
ncbi:MAG: helix-turn-helix transcriptional regulator [Alphaproteobacteria bacterium]